MPSYSDFLLQGAFRGCADVLLFLFFPALCFAGQRSPIWTSLQQKIAAIHVSRLHTFTLSVVELRGSADRLLKMLQLPWMQSSILYPIYEATLHLAYALLKYADSLGPSTEVMPDIISTTEYWIVNNTECDSAPWIKSVVTIIYDGFCLHSLCV